MANTGRPVTMQLKGRVSAGHTLEREWSTEDFALEGQGQHRLLRERVGAGFTQEVLVRSSNPVSKVDFGEVLALEQPLHWPSDQQGCAVSESQTNVPHTSVSERILRD